MSVEQTKQVQIDVENIGGIKEASVTFSPGVTVLSGRNATNRTSCLLALMAALGSDEATVKGDADEAHVEMTLNEETYKRTLSRQDGTIHTSGDPYLKNAAVADLFAFLLDTNESRRAVAQDENLRELIMRPVDTGQIEDRINELLEERQRLDHDIEEIDSLKEELPSLESERVSIQDQIDEKREELAKAEAELESMDAIVEETREEKNELEQAMTELREKRSTLEDIRYDIETERTTLSELRSEQAELSDEREELSEAPTAELDDLNAKIEKLRTRKQQTELELNELKSIVSFNEEMIEDANHEVITEDSDVDVTDRLLPDDTVTCWTCGTTVDTSQIETTIDRLREQTSKKLQTVNELESDIERLTERRQTLKTKQRRRSRIQDRLAEIDDEIGETEETIAELQGRRDELTTEIAEIEADVEQKEDGSYSEVLDIHRKANELEYEIGRLESELDQTEDRISEIERQIDQLDELTAERENVQAEIEDLRTRIDRIERQAIEEFNKHIETVLELLDYDNLERIWLERVERDVRDGRRTVTETLFSLHVVRSTPSGTTYEDTIDHLSESEREVTGLVFALAGYLVHDLHEELPFMLLDSLEAIDAERIRSLVDYFSEYADFLIVALLPDDADALPDSYDRITDI